MIIKFLGKSPLITFNPSYIIINNELLNPIDALAGKVEILHLKYSKIDKIKHYSMLHVY